MRKDIQNSMLYELIQERLEEIASRMRPKKKVVNLFFNYFKEDEKHNAGMPYRLTFKLVGLKSKKYIRSDRDLLKYPIKKK